MQRGLNEGLWFKVAVACDFHEKHSNVSPDARHKFQRGGFGGGLDGSSDPLS